MCRGYAKRYKYESYVNVLCYLARYSHNKVNNKQNKVQEKGSKIVEHE